VRLLNLERQAKERLGCSLVIAQAGQGDGPESLTDQEKSYFHELQHLERKQHWLRGRCALKQVLAAYGRSCNTLALAFPHPCFSLTHAGQFAFSAGVKAGAPGIGIDFEIRRKVNPKTAHWFLTEAELEWLLCQAQPEEPLIRLWTIKEAAFKSCPDNRGMVLKDFVITSLEAETCTVNTPVENRSCKVFSVEHLDGYLTLAICEEV